MAKKKDVSTTDRLQGILQDVQDVTGDAVNDAMLLDAQQRNAVIAGLATVRQGVDKAIQGLAGEYEAPKRKKANAAG